MHDSVFLIKVSDDEEAEDIEEILRNNDIIVSRKYKEIDGYLQLYRAMTIHGVELYVDQKDLGKSQRLLSIDSKSKNDNIKNKETKSKRFLNFDSIISSFR